MLLPYFVDVIYGWSLVDFNFVLVEQGFQPTTMVFRFEDQKFLRRKRKSRPLNRPYRCCAVGKNEVALFILAPQLLDTTTTI